jgi:protein ImuB
LRLPADLVQTLSKLGFDTIGEVEATPKGPLAHRLGLEPIRRLDQAFGREAEPIEPVLAPETPRVARSSPSRSARPRPWPVMSRS